MSVTQFTHNNAISLRKMLGFACVGLMALGIATTAQAGGHRAADNAPTVIRTNNSQWAISIRIENERRESRRQYEAGLAEGQCDGFDAGYRDALRGRCFEDCVTRDFCGRSRSFEEGYRDGYETGYARGFERARCDRNDRCEPRYRRVTQCR